MFRDDDARVETGAGVVGHLPGDEYKLVANHGRHKAGARRRGDTRRIDLVGLVSRLGHDCDQRRRYCRSAAKAALHDYRCARRDVFSEGVVPGEVIGSDRPRVRVVLVEPDTVCEIGAKFLEDATHSPEDEIGLPAALVVMTEQRVAGRPRDGLVDHAGAPVIGLVAGQKEPGPCPHRIGIGDRHPHQIFDRPYVQRHRSGPHRMPRSTAALMGAQGKSRNEPIRLIVKTGGLPCGT